MNAQTKELQPIMHLVLKFVSDHSLTKANRIHIASYWPCLSLKARLALTTWLRDRGLRIQDILTP